MNIAFRVSEPANKLTQFFIELSKHSDKVVVYEHEASQVHVHGLVINCKVSTDTLKNWIRKALGIKVYDKSKWSFKTEYQGQPVNAQFITYMSKGKLDPVYNHNVQMSDIDAYRNAWIQPEKFHSKDKEDKITIWNIAQEVDQIYRTEYGEYQHNGQDEFYQVIDRITPIIVKVLRKYKKGFDVFLVKKILTTAMSSHERFTCVITENLKRFM